MFDKKKRYLQLAFNDDLYQVEAILPNIPYNERILIEAGTPFIKREGMAGISRLSSMWDGTVVADLKTSDGASGEVFLASHAGAKACTVLGSSPIETLNIFIHNCYKMKMASMIDMLGVEDPLKVLMRLAEPPDVVIIHKGRDEETVRGKVIQYRHINRIRSKYDVLISAAGGVDLREARSAIFNGANIVVVNMVNSGSVWQGIEAGEGVEEIVDKFLKTIE